MKKIKEIVIQMTNRKNIPEVALETETKMGRLYQTGRNRQSPVVKVDMIFIPISCGQEFVGKKYSKHSS